MPIAENVRRCAVTQTDISIYYDTFNDEMAANGTLLLLPGMGVQCTYYHEDFVRQLAEAAGLRVVRMDNRDIGHSTKLAKAKSPGVLQCVIAPSALYTPPYSMADMAMDSWALLDFVSVDRVHLAGFCMGGLLCEEMVVLQPHRVLSLNLMMTPSRALRPRSLIAWSNPAWRFFLSSPKTTDVAGKVAFRHAYIRAVLIGSRPTPWTKEKEEYVIAHETYNFERSPFASRRHVACAQHLRPVEPFLQAALEAYPNISVSILHGGSDILFPVQHALHTSYLLPRARLTIVPRLGHYPFPEFWPEYIKAICDGVSAGRASAPLQSRPVEHAAKTPRPPTESTAVARQGVVVMLLAMVAVVAGMGTISTRVRLVESRR